jgi:predicted ArsR family transcriptional regulator
MLLCFLALKKQASDEVRKLIIDAWEERDGSMNQSQLARTLKIPRTAIRNTMNTFNSEGKLFAKTEEDKGVVA